MAINKTINKSTKSHGAMRNCMEYVLKCQTAHCGRCKPRLVLGEFTSPIVPYRNLPQTPGGMTADCRSLV